MSNSKDNREKGSGLRDGAARDVHDIDRVLALATMPELPDGATARLMARIGRERPGEILQFRPKARQAGGLLRYAAALPLAASLALGIYLGAAGSLDFMLPDSLTSDVASSDDLTDDLGGVGEADAYAEESLT